MLSRRWFALTLVVLSAAPALAQQPLPPKLADEIRAEATRANRGAVGRPLPLAGHWNVTGMYREGFTPAYQLELLKKGHRLDRKSTRLNSSH